jgi:hypothetical protein
MNVVDTWCQIRNVILFIKVGTKCSNCCLVGRGRLVSRPAPTKQHHPIENHQDTCFSRTMQWIPIYLAYHKEYDQQSPFYRQNTTDGTTSLTQKRTPLRYVPINSHNQPTWSHSDDAVRTLDTQVPQQTWDININIIVTTRNGVDHIKNMRYSPIFIV